MLTVGDKFPEFNLHACVSREPGKEFAHVSTKTAKDEWQVIFFWPEDFTFVCPTEIAEFGKHHADFVGMNARLLGVSTDSRWVHLAWRNAHPELKDLPFPMLADVKHELSSALGILDKTDGVALRATFIVDPDGIIQWVNVNGLLTGRNIPETVRVLGALQTGERTPCNWQPGQATLQSSVTEAA
jgi:alkyl hydroperoxide reductase subunit AhpC